MQLLHVRHATSILTYAGIRILIDPVLADKETYPAITMTPNRKRNPLVDLSTSIETLLAADVILLTHTHNDHFDVKAKEVIDKSFPIICPYQDEQKLQEDGFLNIQSIKSTLSYRGIEFTRVNAKHGTKGMCKAMGPASGYILKAETEPTLYITGDTVYYPAIRENILKYEPQILLMNAGSPKFLYSERIVMNIMDIENTLRVNPSLTFMIVHLDTFNHCIETRADLHEYFTKEKLEEIGVNRFIIPEDNELIDLP
jgi:L-ascorbate metabolism protein UlaG (beta-lactamase superfamily)